MLSCYPVSFSLLIFSTAMQTGRSTLVAYVSFSSVDDQYVGNPSRGGRLRPHSGKAIQGLQLSYTRKKLHGVVVIVR